MTGADGGHVSPLDVPQQFEQAGSFQVRDKLQQLVERDLLGPWDGETEQFRPRAMGPRERYLVGMLGPKHLPKSTLDDADAVSDTESGVQGETRGDEAGDLPEVLTPQNLGRIWASSMGLSFCVGADIDVRHAPLPGRQRDSSGCWAFTDATRCSAVRLGQVRPCPVSMTSATAPPARH